MYSLETRKGGDLVGQQLAPLTISLLGNFEISIGEREIPTSRFRLRKSRHLFKLLALAPRHRLHREQLMELLWPDFDLEAAANNLHQALYAARRALGAQGYLLYEDENLSFNPAASVWVDVDAFEQAVAEARHGQEPRLYHAALELYTGDLLIEDLYEEWTLIRRESLRQEYLDLLRELGEIYESRGDCQAGIETLQNLVQVDPTNEAAHTGLMRLYALIGQRQLALRQYQALQKALHRELGIEPDRNSTQLYKDIQSGKFLSIAAIKIATEPPATLHNLPSPLSSFIGREREIIKGVEALEIARLVTLTGSGGVGKTRLALRLAEEMVGMYADGAWLVELAPLSEPRHVLRVVAEVFGLQEHKDAIIQQVLLDYLHRKQLLLVLDNCEHLIEACVEVVETILRTCPDIHLLITSREALGITGEMIFYVPSLTSPESNRWISLQHMAEYEAVQLFIARAQEILPDFTVTPANASHICHICQRLDGIPLAIEMAAAMVKVLSPAQIADRLEDCFQLLTRGSRSALPRHQTLRASIDWSYALLSKEEQILLRRLSVFAGRWTLEAAEAICYDEGASVFDQLSHLVDKSLVVADRTAGKVIRYFLLEPIRQYTHRKRAEAGELAVWNDRHLDFYLRMAEQDGLGLRSADVVQALEELDKELDNLRSALGWALRDDPEAKPEKGLWLASTLVDYWCVRGHLSEGIEWLEHGLAHLPGEDASLAQIKAKGCFAAGYLALIRTDWNKARRWLEESVILYRSLGNRPDLAVSQSLLGNVMAERNWYLPPSNSAEYEAARILVEESLEIARLSEEKSVLGWVLFWAGSVATYMADYASAYQLFEESVALFQEIGDILYLENCLSSLGAVNLWHENYQRAFSYTKKALEMAQSIKNKPNMMQCLFYLGTCAYYQRNYEQMATYAFQAVEISYEIGSAFGTIFSLRVSGMAELKRGDYPKATKRFLESIEWAYTRGDEYGLLAGVLWLAETAAEMGETSQAARLLGVVDAHLKTFFKELNPWDREEVERLMVQVQSQFDQMEIAAAWAKGSTLPLERVVQEILALKTENLFSK